MTARPPLRAAMARRVSRRRFLATAAATGGALAAGAVALRCGDDTPKAAPTASPSPRPAAVQATSRGGIFRSFTFDAIVPDSLDPHLTQLGPVMNMHSAVFSKVLRYDDERAGAIVPDLAAAMPEQPDETTYIVTLRDDARFHDAPKYRLAYPNVAGRALTAEDVKFSIERQTNRNSPNASRFYRRGDWSVIDSMDVIDDRTLRIRLSAPAAPFLHFLAGRHAHIIARETVAQGDEAATDLAMIGTGPFMLESLAPGVAVKLRRNPAWFARDDDAGAGSGRPFIDGYDSFLSPQEDAFQRIAFERRDIDSTAFTDPIAADQAHKTNLGDVTLQETDAGGFLATRLLLDRAPFNDDRVRRALPLAVDRDALARLMYPDVEGGPSGRLTGPVCPVMGAAAVAPDELAKRPGYRTDTAGRAEDIATAKQLWAAAFGDAPPPEIRVFAAGVPRTISERALAALQRQYADAFGVTLMPVVDSSGYAVIASSLGRNIDGAAEGTTAFTLMYEDGGVDIDSWLYPHFRSGQPMNTYRLQDPQLDALLDKSRGEFDNDARRKIGLDIQDYLLAHVNARLEYFAPIERRLTWGYVRNLQTPIWSGDNAWLASAWLDASHPAWQGRP